MDDYRALMSRMENLEKANIDLREHIGFLEDESEIGRIQHMCGCYIDKRMWDAMTDLFAETGSIEIGRRGRYIGKERVDWDDQQRHQEPWRRRDLFREVSVCRVD